MTKAKKVTKRRRGQSASKAMLGGECPKECWDKAFNSGYRAGAQDERAAIARTLLDKKMLVLTDFYYHKPYLPND